MPDANGNIRRNEIHDVLEMRRVGLHHTNGQWAAVREWLLLLNDGTTRRAYTISTDAFSVPDFYLGTMPFVEFAALP